MRFELTRFGRFAAILRPAEVLEDLLFRAGFWELPTELAAGPQLPDAFGYELTVARAHMRLGMTTDSCYQAFCPCGIRGIDGFLRASNAGGMMWDTEQKTDIVHDNEWVTLWYHPAPKIVHHKFHKAIRGEAFQTALTMGTDMLRAHGASKWLADDRLFFVLPQEDQEWAEGEWFPRTRQVGWKYWAIVKPEMAVTDLYLRRVAASRTAEGVRMEVFPTPTEAAEWLQNVDRKPRRASLSRHRLPKL